MQHLIVYAHPNPASYSAAIRDRLASDLLAAGHEVEVRDLYAQNYNPVLSGADFVGLQSGQLPEDILAEQAAVRKADVIHLVYPTWWVGMPAILKGWVDRTFLFGFAYTVGEQGISPLLTDKKVRIWQPVGHPGDVYEANGKTEAMLRTIDSGIFEFSGVQVLSHHFFWAVPYVDDAARKAYLDQIAQVLQS
jgi:NAD(P)H dehydrogenase (quinone)